MSPVRRKQRTDSQRRRVHSNPRRGPVPHGAASIESIERQSVARRPSAAVHTRPVALSRQTVADLVIVFRAKVTDAPNQRLSHAALQSVELRMVVMRMRRWDSHTAFLETGRSEDPLVILDWAVA